MSQPQADSRPILIVLHQEHSTPGRVGQALRARGFTLDIRRPALGDPLPETMAGHRAAIVFGGPMSANDDLDYIRTEIDWIGVPLKEEAPFWGICLGGQLMAKRLGATVYGREDDKVEIGYYPIHPTEEGRDLFTDPTYVYQWHREGFELPSGAVRLAESESYPVQAMRYGANAYGIQFHPELTALMMNIWLTRGRERLELPGAQPAAAHRRARHQYDLELRAWLERFLDHWLGESGERSGGTL